MNDLSDKFGGLDNSVISYLDNTERGQASMDGLSKSIANSSAEMSSATIKAELLSKAMNILTNIATTLIINFVAWGLDELIVTLDEQKEKLEDSITAYENLEEELQNIRDELKTTAERIDELNGKDNLTFTEQDELEKLIKTNEELERKIFLLEQANKEAEKEVVAEAQKTYDKTINNRTMGAVDQIDFYTNSSLLEGVNWDNFKNDLPWLVAQYQKQEDLLSEAEAEGWSNIEEQARNNLTLLEGYMAEASQEYQTLYDQIGGISEYSMTEDLKVAKQDLNDILDIVANILGYGGQRSTTILNNIFSTDGIEKTKEELLQLAKSGELTPETIKGYTNLNKALEETTLSAEELCNELYAESGTKSRQELIDIFGQNAVDNLSPEDLQIALTISTEEANKAIEEEKKKVETELRSLSKEGNVDLTIRPVIDSSAMQAAGWDVEDGSIATTFTQGEFIWQGDEENGQYVYVHYTPILPDGTVLTPEELTDYLYGTLEASEDILDSDDKGLVLKVDTELNIPEDDIKKFQNGEGSTKEIDGLIQKTGEWDDKVHSVQEQYYDTGDGIGYVETALDGLIAKHNELGKDDETTILLENVEH